MSERARAFRSGGTMTLSGGSHLPCPQIKVVKQSNSVIVSRRRDELLKQADYMEAQANRLANMARELRAMITHLTIE